MRFLIKKTQALSLDEAQYVSLLHDQGDEEPVKQQNAQGKPYTYQVIIFPVNIAHKLFFLVSCSNLRPLC